MTFVLLTFFGNVSIARLLEADRSGVRIDAAGTVIPINERLRSAVNIGRVDDQDLDCGVWLNRWLDVIGRDAGPLFPKWDRGSYLAIAMNHVAALSAIKRFCKRANVSDPQLPKALRHSSLVATVEECGSVIAANHIGCERTSVARAIGKVDWSRGSIMARHARQTRRAPLTPTVASQDTP